MLDKKINDDINIVYQHKDKLKDRIQSLEEDYDKFKIEFD